MSRMILQLASLLGILLVVSREKESRSIDTFEEVVAGPYYSSGPIVSIGKTTITVKAFDAISVVNGKQIQTEGNDVETVQVGTPLRVQQSDGAIYFGVKLITTKKGITIVQEDGKTVNLLRSEQPQRTFQFEGDLAKGRFVENALPSLSYRVSDLKVGDLVTFRYVRLDGVEHVRSIGIARRPGGKGTCLAPQTGAAEPRLSR